MSARGLAQRDPELLADLMEAYYVDDEHDWHHDEGVRRHQGRWTGYGGPFFMYYFGGFWQLFHRAHFQYPGRVLNNIMNSGANARVRTIIETQLPTFSRCRSTSRRQRRPVDGAGDEETSPRKRGCQFG